jgi:hypothetical protein
MLQQAQDFSRTLPDALVGDSLERAPGEAAALAKLVFSGQLRSRKVDVVSDGDKRYWGVDPSQSPLLGRLMDFADVNYKKKNGSAPAFKFIMINHVSAQECPTGSGGGWHRDSFGTQYKAFMYLTDVERPSQGAFCYLPGSNAVPLRTVSLVHRLVSGGHRYTDDTIQRLLRRGAKATPVLLPAGTPFFLSTSYIHRGLPITEGDRVMAAVYLFKRFPDEFASYTWDTPAAAAR